MHSPRLVSVAVTVALGIAFAAGAVLVGGPALADTYLLRDGARIDGQEAEEFEGPGKAKWLRVPTTFGSTSFPKKSLKKRIKTKREAGPLRCEQVMVTTLKGVVERSRDEGATWTAISPRDTLQETRDELPVNHPNSVVAPGDRVRTGGDGEVDLDLGWGVVHLAVASELGIEVEGAATVRLLRGSAGARMDALPADAEFRVETPQTSMGVRGTTFAVVVTEGSSRLVVQEGTVAVGEHAVTSDQALEVATDGTATPDTPNGGDRALFNRLRTTYSIPRIDRVRIPGGQFELGNPPNGKPSTVSIEPFELARTEITVAQFRVFEEWMAAHNDHYFCHPAEPPGVSHKMFGGSFFNDLPARKTWYPEFFDDAQQPAVGVNWFGAYAFSAWIGAYLPSHSRWTWAARAGESKAPSAAEVARLGWVNENTGSAGRPIEPSAPWPDDVTTLYRSFPVGTRPPNAFGLHDVWGNASEWLMDQALPDTIPLPSDGSPLEQPQTEEMRLDPRSAGGVRRVAGGDFESSAGGAPTGQSTFPRGPYPGSGLRPEFRGR